MGRTTIANLVVKAKLESLRDLYQAESGQLPRDQVRQVIVPDALVDTGATGLMAPGRVIGQLGLQ